MHSNGNWMNEDQRGEMRERAAAAENAKLAAIRATPHNGQIFQADDVDYLLALADTMGNGLGAINPQWFRDQARLVKGTLEELAAKEAEIQRLWKRITDSIGGER